MSCPSVARTQPIFVTVEPTTAPSQWGRKTSVRQDPPFVCSFDVKPHPGRSWLGWRQRRPHPRLFPTERSTKTQAPQGGKSWKKPLKSQSTPSKSVGARELTLERSSVTSGSQTGGTTGIQNDGCKEKPKEAVCEARLQYHDFTRTRPTEKNPVVDPSYDGQRQEGRSPGEPWKHGGYL